MSIWVFSWYERKKDSATCNASIKIPSAVLIWGQLLVNCSCMSHRVGWIMTISYYFWYEKNSKPNRTNNNKRGFNLYFHHIPYGFYGHHSLVNVPFVWVYAVIQYLLSLIGIKMICDFCRLSVELKKLLLDLVLFLFLSFALAWCHLKWHFMFHSKNKQLTSQIRGRFFYCNMTTHFFLMWAISPFPHSVFYF